MIIITETLKFTPLFVLRTSTNNNQKLEDTKKFKELNQISILQNLPINDDIKIMS